MSYHFDKGVVRDPSRNTVFFFKASGCGDPPQLTNV